MVKRKVYIRIKPYLKRVRTRRGKKQRVIRAHKRHVIREFGSNQSRDELAKEFYVKQFGKSPEQHHREFEQWRDHGPLNKISGDQLHEMIKTEVRPSVLSRLLKENQRRIDVEERPYRSPIMVRARIPSSIIENDEYPSPTEKSMAAKVRELGIDSDQFKKDIFELDDIITNKLTLPLNYSGENIRKEVYPKLRELKQKYGIDIPIGLVGIDLPRLDMKLDSELENKKNIRRLVR